jgi:hypothetical protein
MYKTLLTPENNDLRLSIPDSYIGKEIEVLIYAKDEFVAYTSKQEITMGDLSGILSETDYQLLKEHTEQSRKEWDRAI